MAAEYLRDCLETRTTNSLCFKQQVKLTSFHDRVKSHLHCLSQLILMNSWLLEIPQWILYQCSVCVFWEHCWHLFLLQTLQLQILILQSQSMSEPRRWYLTLFHFVWWCLLLCQQLSVLWRTVQCLSLLLDREVLSEELSLNPMEYWKEKETDCSLWTLDLKTREFHIQLSFFIIVTVVRVIGIWNDFWIGKFVSYIQYSQHNFNNCLAVCDSRVMVLQFNVQLFFQWVPHLISCLCVTFGHLFQR